MTCHRVRLQHRQRRVRKESRSSSAYQMTNAVQTKCLFQGKVSLQDVSMQTKCNTVLGGEKLRGEPSLGGNSRPCSAYMNIAQIKVLRTHWRWGVRDCITVIIVHMNDSRLPCLCLLTSFHHHGRDSCGTLTVRIHRCGEGTRQCPVRTAEEIAFHATNTNVRRATCCTVWYYIQALE